MNLLKYILVLLPVATAGTVIWTSCLWSIKFLFLETAEGVPQAIARDATHVFAATLLALILIAHRWHKENTFPARVAQAAGHVLLGAALLGTFREPIGGTVVGLLGGVILLPMLIFGGYWQILLFRFLYARFLAPDHVEKLERQ